MKKIKAIDIINDQHEVKAIIEGKETNHYIRFNSLKEAEKFFEEILEYNEYRVINIKRTEAE